MADSRTQILIQQPNPNPLPVSNQPQILLQSPESYRVYERITDSELLYAKDLVRLLMNADIYKSDQLDPNSPIAGFAIQKTGTDDMAMTLEGCRRVMSICLLFYNQALSTTETDPKKFDLELFSLNATMAIMDMIIANRKKWQFRDPMLIKPLGMCIWRNQVAIGLRSHSGGKFMRMLLNPAVFGSQPQGLEKPRSRWLP